MKNILNSILICGEPLRELVSMQIKAPIPKHKSKNRTAHDQRRTAKARAIRRAKKRGQA